jgi:hypothetical protein
MQGGLRQSANGVGSAFRRLPSAENHFLAGRDDLGPIHAVPVGVGAIAVTVKQVDFAVSPCLAPQRPHQSDGKQSAGIEGEIADMNGGVLEPHGRNPHICGIGPPPVRRGFVWIPDAFANRFAVRSWRH